jgi:hypothetical protein
VTQIAESLSCNRQTVRNAIHAFNDHGLEALQRRQPVPKATQTAFEALGIERLREVLHQFPRDYGKEASLWTLTLAAEVSHEQGITDHQVSYEIIRTAMGRLGTCPESAEGRAGSGPSAGCRAPTQSTPERKASGPPGCPDPSTPRLGGGLPGRNVYPVRGTWWSRVSRPSVSPWADAGPPARLVEQAVPPGEPRLWPAAGCY